MNNSQVLNAFYAGRAGSSSNGAFSTDGNSHFIPTVCGSLLTWVLKLLSVITQLPAPITAKPLPSTLAMPVPCPVLSCLAPEIFVKL